MEETLPTRVTTSWTIVADVHVGNHPISGGPVVGGINDRCRRIVEVLGTAARACAVDPNGMFAIAGDTFDRWSTHPQIVDAVIEALKPVIDRTVVLVGNHDMRSADDRDNAVSLLTHAGVTVVSKSPKLIRGALFVPFLPEPAEQYLPRVVDPVLVAGGAFGILVGHFGISDETTAPFLVGAPDSVRLTWFQSFLRERVIQGAVVGNWHEGKVWKDEHTKTAIAQCGALVPTGWDNPGFPRYGGVVRVRSDGSGLSRSELPGPRFVSCTRAQVPVLAEVAPAGTQLYLRIADAAPGELDIVRAEALAAFDGKAAALVNVEIDPRGAKVGASQASAHARVVSSTQGSVAETLHAFIAARYPDADAQELTKLGMTYLEAL